MFLLSQDAENKFPGIVLVTMYALHAQLFVSHSKFDPPRQALSRASSTNKIQSIYM